MNIAHNLEKSAFCFPERPAVREGDRVMSYGDLNDRASRVASSLHQMGVKRGERVGLCAPNSADWIVFYYGVLKAGAVAVTLSPLLSSDEFKLLVRHAKPRIVYTTASRLGDLTLLRDEGVVEHVVYPEGRITMESLVLGGSDLFETVERGRRETAAILYTGGTTGTPKGVMLTHEGSIQACHTIAYLERSCETDVSLCFLPFNHVFGQMHVMNSTIYSSGCLEMLPSFDLDRILELTASGRITKFFSVPTVFVRLLNVPDLKKKLGKVRYCFSAGASLAAETVKAWREATGMTIAESFGQTECICITYNHYYPEKHVVGAVGQPIPMVEVQIRDASTGKPLKKGEEGEICVRGRNVMKGYLNNPDGNREAFWGQWLRTGDMGRIDDNGYVYIVDRLKDMIITGGENVYSREVEEALYAKPEIEECAVLGVPDKEWGERVITYLTVKPGRELAADDLKAHLKLRLAPFKVPKEYIQIKEFPKSPAGKILKRELKKMYQEVADNRR